MVDDGRGCGDQIKIEFALQSLLNDLIMQQPEEAAAEAEAQRQGGLGFEGQRSVIDLQAFECVFQITVAGTVDRVHAAKDHLLRFFVAGQGLGGFAIRKRNGIADFCITDILHRGNQVAYIPALQHLLRQEHAGTEITDFCDDKFSLCMQHVDAVAGFDLAVTHTNMHDNAAVGIVLGIEDQGAERPVLIAFRRRQVLHDFF